MTTPLDAFIARMLEIYAIPQRLTASGVAPEIIDWGNVDMPHHHAQLLRQVDDRAFQKGAHAD